jgi:hypothetical protein
VISNQSNGADRGSAAAQCRNESKHQQAFERRGRHAAQGGEHIDGQPGINGPLPAEAIQQRPIDHLAEREANEVHRHAERHARNSDIEIRRDLREGRQIQVDGERRQRIQKAEHDD